MKPYFIDFEVIKGKVREGDIVAVNSDQGENVYFLYKKTKNGLDHSTKYLPFLYTKNIKVGDKIFYLSRNHETLFEGVLAKIKGEYIFLEEDRMTGYPVEYDSFHMSYELSTAFKKIGMVSLEAFNYIKSKDEFDEEDVQLCFWPGGFGSELWNVIPWDIVSILPEDRDKLDTLVKIKGPCGHFH